MKVERADGDVDSYPSASAFRTDGGELTIKGAGESFIAHYVKGSWVRVYCDERA